MITKHTKTYEGKQYTFHTGLDEQGNAPIRIDYGHVSEDKKQPQRAIGRRVLIELDDDGIPVEVYTTLEHQQFFNDGSLARGVCVPEPFRMADEELPEFQAMFGRAFQQHIYNIFARGGKHKGSIGLGQNANPPFVDGAFVPDEVSAPGTFTYPHDPIIPADEATV